MSHRTLGLAVAIVIALIISGTGLRGCKKSAQAEELGKEQTKPTAPETPQTWGDVEEDVWIDFVDQPGEKFHKARESFLKKDFKNAAAEIRKGAAFLKLEAARSTKEGKELLMSSVYELKKLAKDVDAGEVTSAKMLDEAFARAHHALARHHHIKATEYHAKGEMSKMGHALKAAATHLEHGLAWSGHKLEAGTVEVLKETGLVAGKLIEGTGWVASGVGKAIDEIGKEIAKLGRMVEPAKREHQTQGRQTS